MRLVGVLITLRRALYDVESADRIALQCVLIDLICALATLNKR
jgi:hypothetical protein